MASKDVIPSGASEESRTAMNNEDGGLVKKLKAFRKLEIEKAFKLKQF